MKSYVYPLGTDQPEAAIGLSERVDFHVGELDAPLAQGPEGFDPSLESRDDLYRTRAVKRLGLTRTQALSAAG